MMIAENSLVPLPFLFEPSGCCSLANEGWSGGAEEERLTSGGGTRPLGVFEGTAGNSCLVMVAGEETSGDSDPEVDKKLSLGRSL